MLFSVAGRWELGVGRWLLRASTRGAGVTRARTAAPGCGTTPLRHNAAGQSLRDKQEAQVREGWCDFPTYTVGLVHTSRGNVHNTSTTSSPCRPRLAPSWFRCIRPRCVLFREANRRESRPLPLPLSLPAPGIYRLRHHHPHHPASAMNSLCNSNIFVFASPRCVLL